jgi:chemosensory pili system protein ChpC
MSGQVQSASAVNELATLLLPVNGKQLVLPNVTVAEIIPYQEVEAVDDMPEWYVGMLLWRNQKIPLVSFDTINGEPFNSQNPEQRIAVINSIIDDDRLHFFGIVTEGVPRLMRVMADEMSADAGEEPGPAEMSRVMISGERAAIPDIDYIQNELLKLL